MKLLVFLFILVITGCTYQQELIKIGALLPLTGERADDAATVKNGIDLAIKEVNQLNALKGTLYVVYADSRCDASAAERAALKLILADGVRAIIGDICPESTIAAARVAQANNAIVLNLAPHISQDEITFSINGSTSHPVFVKLYERVYNNTPNNYAARGYTAVKTLADALKSTDYTGSRLSIWFTEHLP